MDPGVGPGGPGPSSLFLDQTEAQRAKKFLFLILHLPFLRVWMTPPPPFLKIWIWHWLNRKSNSCSTSFKWQKGQIWRFSGVLGTVCLPVSISKRWLPSLNLFGVFWWLCSSNHWDLNYCIGWLTFFMRLFWFFSAISFDICKQCLA